MLKLISYNLVPLRLGRPQNKLADSPSTPKRSSLWLPVYICMICMYDLYDMAS